MQKAMRSMQGKVCGKICKSLKNYALLMAAKSVCIKAEFIGVKKAKGTK
ncbi:hypothetical protein [Helicobacter sp. T3_23-1056]